jgi:hypothetical protein
MLAVAARRCQGRGSVRFHEADATSLPGGGRQLRRSVVVCRRKRRSEGPTGDEATAWAAEQRELGRRGEFYFACIQFCFSAVRAG